MLQQIKLNRVRTHFKGDFNRVTKDFSKQISKEYTAKQLPTDVDYEEDECYRHKMEESIALSNGGLLQRSKMTRA